MRRETRVPVPEAINLPPSAIPAGGGGMSDSFGPQPAESVVYPTAYQAGLGGGPRAGYPVDYANALNRVSTPAVCLIVTAVLGLIAANYGLDCKCSANWCRGSFWAKARISDTGNGSNGDRFWHHWDCDWGSHFGWRHENEVAGKLYSGHDRVDTSHDSLYLALLSFRIAVWDLGDCGFKRSGSKIGV